MMTDAGAARDIAFVCPQCVQKCTEIRTILLDSDGSGLSCRRCKERWEVKNGIPRFVASSNYADSFGLQWNAHRVTQLDSHTGFPISRNRLFQVTQWPERMDGQVILEAGSGAGRFTEILAATGATVFSCDYSTAIDANKANNGGNANLRLFQADICHLPLPKASFDKVMCLGVLQHTPDPKKTFMRLAEHVRPGGEIVIDIYASKWSAFLQWKYILRPITKRLGNEAVYALTSLIVPILLPAAVVFRRVGGRFGARLLPIVEYSHLGLPADLNLEWAKLDTFDMYSPAHDHPQSIGTVTRWFVEAGLCDVNVMSGPNGVTGRGRRPVS
jgi:SAM-dependent methyltransferase